MVYSKKYHCKNYFIKPTKEWINVYEIQPVSIVAFRKVKVFSSSGFSWQIIAVYIKRFLVKNIVNKNAIENIFFITMFFFVILLSKKKKKLETQ